MTLDTPDTHQDAFTGTLGRASRIITHHMIQIPSVEQRARQLDLRLDFHGNDKVWRAPQNYLDSVNKIGAELVFPQGPSKGAIVKSVIEECKEDGERSVVLLVPNATDTKWFKMIAYFTTFCYILGRPKFIGNRVRNCTPACGYVFAYVGPNIAGFVQEFSQYTGMGMFGPGGEWEVSPQAGDEEMFYRWNTTAATTRVGQQTAIELQRLMN